WAWIGESRSRPGRAIQRILDSLANLDSLVVFSLRGFRLETVPEGIRQLRRLKSLNLSGLGLTELPDWIGDLELESFSATNNKLSAVPDSFRSLQRLRSLDLSDNPLGEIPRSAFDLVS